MFESVLKAIADAMSGGELLRLTEAIWRSDHAFAFPVFERPQRRIAALLCVLIDPRLANAAGETPTVRGINDARVSSLGAPLAGEFQPRFTAPTNQQELDARVAELRRHYELFLRSLPQPSSASRKRVALPQEWKFRFEAKETPKVEGVPQA